MRGVFHFVVVLAAMAIALAGCDRREPTAATPPPAAPAAVVSTQRVVVLSPALAVIVRDLGYADRVVARHAYDDVLASELPAVGDQAGIDYEALLRVKPTHVLLQWGARDVPERLTQLAQSNEWQVTNSNPLTLADIERSVREIDAALAGSASPTPAADALLRGLEQIRAPQDTGAAFGPVLLLASVDPPAALGPGSCHDEILRGVGGAPALTQGTPWMELSREDIVRLKPRAIILVRPHSARGVTDADGAPGERTTDVWQPLRGLGLAAVDENRIAVIDDPEGLLPSTSMIRVADTMRKVILTWRTTR